MRLEDSTGGVGPIHERFTGILSFLGRLSVLLICCVCSLPSHQDTLEPYQ